MTNPLPFFTWPDGSAPFTERFTELTALETAYNGTEHARIGRAFPRYGLSAAFVSFDDEVTTFGDIEAGLPVLVPAWMHALPGPTAPAVPVIHAPGLAKLFAVRTTSGAIQSLTAPVSGVPAAISSGWLASHVTAYPVLPMRLDADSFDVQVLGPSASTTNLSFTTDALFEPIPAYAGALSLGLPLLESKHNWRAKPTRQTSFSANSFDAGNVATWELRYRKASVSVSFDLWGRAEILAFRLFIRQLRGRYQQFRWVAFDGVERTYRLTSDVWELSYTGTHTASCALRFTEI